MKPTRINGTPRFPNCQSNTQTSPFGREDWLQGEKLEEQLSYWRAQLAMPRRCSNCQRIDHVRRSRRFTALIVT